MAMSEDILSQISMPALAAQLGTDEATARQAAEQALPVLLAGITGDAATPGRREALARAAADDHDPSVLRAEDPLAVVDEQDGDRIVDHVLRDQRPQVEAQLQGLVGGGSGMAGKVLRMLAPLVMSWLAGRMLGGGSSTSSGGGLGDVLGDVLGGATGTSGTSGGALGDILGSVLGGESGDGSPGGGGLGDILGSVLGGGARDPGDDDGDASGVPDLGEILGQLGGAAGRGGGGGGGGSLEDLIGSVLSGRR